MSNCYISICRPDSTEPFYDILYKQISVVNIKDGRAILFCLDEYIKKFDALSTFGYRGFKETLNGLKLTYAIDILAKALAEMHCKYKIFADEHVLEARRFLEKLLDMCHEVANSNVDEWNKSESEFEIIILNEVEY